MANTSTIQNNTTANQAVGNSLIVYGNVKAQSEDGVIRTLQPNSPIFAGDKIITHSDGMISIVFNDAAGTQLDLGRMSEVVIDEDIFQGEIPNSLAEAAVEVENIQEALLTGDFDPTAELEATAAGTTASTPANAGGGISLPRFDLTGQEVTPISGAETTGVSLDFVASDPTILEGVAATIPAAAPLATPPVVPPVATPEDSPAATNFFPSAGEFSSLVEERGLPEGTVGPDGSLTTTSGTIADLGINFGGDGAGFLRFNNGFSGDTEDITLNGNHSTIIEIDGQYGLLTVFGDGTWQYAITSNTIDHHGINLVGADDTVPDNFSFTVYDSNGDSATGHLVINILDDGPVVVEGGLISRVVEEEAMDPETQSVGAIEITGTATTSVDHWHFTHNGGPLTIDMLSETGSPWQDIDGDGSQVPLDTHIRLYNDDGALDPGDEIDSNDDSSPGASSDGSTHSFDSLLTFGSLPAGDYILAVGDYHLTTNEAISGVNSEGTGISSFESTFGPYQIRIIGDTTITTAPDGGYVTSVPSLSDGNPDHDDLSPEDATQPDSAVVTGNFNSIVDIGADNPGTFKLLSTNDLPDLISQGENIYYVINGDTLEAWAGGLSPRESLPDDTDNGPAALFNNDIAIEDEPRLVFTFQVESDGNYTFTLLDQLDHVPPSPGTAVENSALQLAYSGEGGPSSIAGLDFSTLIRATDSDGDWVEFDEGTVSFTIEDDIPIFTGETIHRVVEEEMLNNDQSTGNPDHNDGPEDSWFNDPGMDNSTVVYGSLSNLISIGSDEWPDTYEQGSGPFNFINDPTAPDGLTSQGEDVWYEISGNTLTAYAGSGSDGPTTDDERNTSQTSAIFDQDPDEHDDAEPRVVFTLTLNGDGSYSYILVDQLDHEEGNGENHLNLDFSPFVTVTDFDGDRINLGDFISASPDDESEDMGAPSGVFVITVVDDIPVANDVHPGTVSGKVFEDGLTLDSSEEPDDYSEGNKESGEDNDADQTSGASGSLTPLFIAGADENTSGSPALTLGISTDVSLLSDLNLQSQGHSLQYSSDGSVLTAAWDTDASHTVFTLEVDADGGWRFDLDDQLDHVDDGMNNENLSLVGSNDVGGGIDFSAIITATDFDGDTVTGAANDSFIIQVEDDVPETAFTGNSFFVSEYAGYDNIIGTYELDDSGNPVNAHIYISSSNSAAGGSMGENETPMGAYTAGTKFFLIANGVNDSDLGDLTSATLNFVENPGSGPAYLLEINGSTTYDSPVYYMDVSLNADGFEHFKDENGNFLNAVPAEGGEIRVEDLSLGDADYDDTVLRVEVGPVVDEANLPDGSEPDDASLTVFGNLFTGTGGVKIDTGADESGTLVVNGNAITPTNSGANLASSPELVMDSSGDSITVNSEAGTLTINDNGDWSYTLEQNTTVHPDNDPGGAGNTDGDSDRGTGDQVQDIFDLSFTDADGDEIHPQIVININDDGPTAMDDTGSAFGFSSYEGSDDSPEAVLFDVLANDTQGADGASLIDAVVEGGDDVGTVAIVNGQVEFTPGESFSGAANITYTIEDGDGDTSQANLAVTERLLKVGSNVDDRGPGGDNYVVGEGSGTITGGTAADILIGDYGGTGIVQGNLNLLMILDTSGSMSSNDRIGKMETAVNNLMDTLGDSDLSNIRIHLVEYNYLDETGTIGPGSVYEGTYDLRIDGVEQDFTAAQTAVTALDDGGFTNYEAGMQQGLSWIYTDNSPTQTGSIERAEADGGPLDGGTNVTLFLTDGNPNRYVKENGDENSGNSNRSMEEVLNASNTDTDNTSEVNALRDWGTLRAIGIDITAAASIARLDLIDETGNAVTTTADALSDVLPDVLSTSLLNAVGDDKITGKGGDDVIFGDALYTDDLADAVGLVGYEGAGWGVFEQLEGGTVLGYEDWSRTDTINYILDNQEELSQTSEDGSGNGREGGNDTLLGGSGDDSIYGQEGDDIIQGQADDDTLVGGPGEDTISGGSGEDNIDGGDDDDTIHGNSGDDDIKGGAGEDELFGDEGNDNIEGGPGDDDLFGGGGNDNLYGDSGNDDLYGNRGEDQLIGGEGEDNLAGGRENDTLVGDDVDFSDPNDPDIVEDNAPDTISGGPGTDTAGDAPAADPSNADTITDVESPVEDDIDTLVPPPEII